MHLTLRESACAPLLGISSQFTPKALLLFHLRFGVVYMRLLSGESSGISSLSLFKSFFSETASHIPEPINWDEFPLLPIPPLTLHKLVLIYFFSSLPPFYIHSSAFI